MLASGRAGPPRVRVTGSHRLQAVYRQRRPGSSLRSWGRGTVTVDSRRLTNKEIEGREGARGKAALFPPRLTQLSAPPKGLSTQWCQVSGFDFAFAFGDFFGGRLPGKELKDLITPKREGFPGMGKRERERRPGSATVSQQVNWLAGADLARLQPPTHPPTPKASVSQPSRLGLRQSARLGWGRRVWELRVPERVWLCGCTDSGPASPSPGCPPPSRKAPPPETLPL